MVWVGLFSQTALHTYWLMSVYVCVGHVVCRQDKKVKQSLLQVKDRIHALEGTSPPYNPHHQYHTKRIIPNMEPISKLRSNPPHLLVPACFVFARRRDHMDEADQERGGAGASGACSKR